VQDLAGLYEGLKFFVIVGDCLSELHELPEEILGAAASNLQLAGRKPDSARKARELAECGVRRDRDFDSAGGELTAGSLEVVNQALATLDRVMVRVTSRNLRELLHELGPVDEERLAGLVTAELVHEADGCPPVDGKDTLQRSAVDDGRGQVLQDI
jgi:hypothetical protein